MPISSKDREIWRLAMKDVTPLDKSVMADLPVKIPVVKPPARDQHIWDLHGMTLDQAHQLALSQVHQYQARGGSITFITGKSGQINHEFPHWLASHAQISKIDSLNGGGAYRVWFRKNKNKKH